MRADDLLLPVPPLELSWTVNDVLSRHPSTAAVFNAFGMDTCCGGGHALGVACVEAGADPEIVLASLRAMAGGAP
jgi:regulator of cell morphogenesis and NO signaling